MKKTTYIISVLVVLIVIVAESLILINQNAEKTTVNIGYKKHVAYMPLFIAQEKGFFEQEGLTVNPIIFDSTNQMMAAVVSGDIDASLGGANLQTVYSIEEKSPNSMKVFTTLDVNEDTGITCVMVKSDSDISSMSELEGKKSATLPGTFAPIWINAALKTVGLNKEDIEIQGLDAKLQLAALESGQVDVVFTVEPACSFGVNKGIGKIIYTEPLRHLGSSLTASIISTKLIEENPNVADKIVAATDKAVDFIRENPEESMDIMAKYADYKPDSIKGMKTPVYSKSTEISEENLQDLADKLYAEGDLASRLDVSRIIYK
ncbi:ABC transporter substrate-binding protein [Candidatus Woesearchaeota archaeon]|nr:ABC transporter substrate-binding protein [Candidatus Woesearchaeota archaeon]